LKIFVIGSSITSSYWNGAATYYRGIYRALHGCGHEITFAEPDVFGRQSHRDVVDADFPYVRSWVYHTPRDLEAVISAAANDDLVIKHSGVGADDAFLEARIAELRSATTRVAFWDVDAPATLTRIEADQADPFRNLIAQYDFIFTYGGGEQVVEDYRGFGAQNCHPIYNALDPDHHFPMPEQTDLVCDLAFVGNRLPDREKRVEDFFLRAAILAPEMRFVLGGEGWETKTLPANIRWIGHVGTGMHNAVNCSARIVLNINRDSMATFGFSPPTRIFEAAGAGACLITDRWTGIEQFFTPGDEILVASSAEEIVAHLRSVSLSESKDIGLRMRARALRDHTYAQRGRDVDRILSIIIASAAA
jgi:spore maturation protein CgeB